MNNDYLYIYIYIYKEKLKINLNPRKIIDGRFCLIDENTLEGTTRNVIGIDFNDV